MSKQRFAAPMIYGSIAVLVLSALPCSWVSAQTSPANPVTFRINGPSQRLEMVVTSSRILTLEKKIPRLLVNNPDLVRATPLSPNQIQLSALRAGVTQLNVWDEEDQLYTVDVIVFADARELENLIQTEFPDAAVRIRPLANSVYLSGYVPSAAMVHSIVRMAEDYYPNVINNLTVGGVQQILLKVKVMEVSRTKLRAAGFDWANLDGGDFVVQSVSGLIASATTGTPAAAGTGADTVAFGIVDGSTGFFGFIEALRQYNLVKVLAEPTLVTVSGRPASFNSGGEFPIPVPQSLGTVSIEYRQFGTRVDFVPLVLGNGNVRLEVRPMISEIDSTRSVTINSITVPGLRTRWVDTAVEMKAGQTLALAGLIQNRVESENRGIPWLADLPWFGAPFRRVEESNNEIELLILVTPEFVDALDPEEVPPLGPGETTVSPSDVELYWRGYLEVPRCCTDGSCPTCQMGLPSGTLPPIEEVQPVPPQDQPGSFDPSARRPGTGSIQGASGPSIQQQGQRRQPVRAQVTTDSKPTTTLRQPKLIGPVGYEEVK